MLGNNVRCVCLRISLGALIIWISELPGSDLLRSLAILIKETININIYIYIEICVFEFWSSQAQTGAVL